MTAEDVKKMGRVHFVMPTFTGKRVDLAVPTPSAVCLEDIAHALGNECRYSGHTQRFYSVAEHCVRLSYVVPKDWQKEALMHDAAEAYLKDVPRQIKQMGMMNRYIQIQTTWDTAIRLKWGLRELNTAIKKLDLAMVSAECEHACLLEWNSMAQIDTATDKELRQTGGEIYAKFQGGKYREWGWGPDEAGGIFIRRAWELGIR